MSSHPLNGSTPQRFKSNPPLHQNIVKSTNAFLLFFASAILLSLSVQAQTRTCRLLYPERPKDAPKVAYLFDGENNHQVTLPSLNFSNVVELPDGPLTLALSPNEILNPENVPKDLPLLKVSQSVSHFYILFTPDKKNKTLPVKMNLVSAGSNKLKPGQTLWYNMTPHQIGAILGEEKLVLKPQSHKISDGPISKSGYYVAQLAYQANGKGDYAPITKQSWWHDAKSRHVGFVVNTGGKLPKVYYFRDFRLPKSVRDQIEKAKTDPRENIEPVEAEDPVVSEQPVQNPQ